MNKLNLFIEASAKTGFNSKKIFIKAAKMLFDEHLKYKDADIPNVEVEEKSVEILKQPDKNKDKKKGCC